MDDDNARPIADPPVLAFHKPKGVTVTTGDELGRRTVYDLLPAWVRSRGFIPVGRLDMDSRGLLLFVDDGRLMDRLSRPGSCPKIYELWVRGVLTPAHVAAMVRGVETPVGVLRAESAELQGGTGPRSRVLITLREGKNRHIRRMVAALAAHAGAKPFKVTDLKRLSIGPILLDLPSGTWRWLTQDEVTALLKSAGA